LKNVLWINTCTGRPKSRRPQAVLQTVTLFYIHCDGDYTMSAVHGIKKKPHQTQRPRRVRATSRPKITRQKRPMTFDSEDEEDEDEDELVPINKTAALIAASLQPPKKASKKK
jgi:hypothetical protein